MTTRGFFAPIVVTALVALLVVPAQAQVGSGGVAPAAPRDLTRPNAGIDEKIGAQLPVDTTFRDETDQPITIRDCINGKPTILVPMYYRCPMLCNEVLRSLVETLRKAAKDNDYVVGNQFNVLCVSFDYKEHAREANLKRDVTLKEYGWPGAEKGWRFLTGSKEAVTELMETVGYRFEFDKAYKEYNHPSGLIIVSPEGKVTRYFYGIDYDGEFRVPGGKTTLRLSLIEAADGKGGSLLDKLTLLCYRFDHLSKGYSLNVLRTVQIGGLLTLFLIGTGVAIALRRERRASRATAQVDTPAAPQPHDGLPSGGTA